MKYLVFEAGSRAGYSSEIFFLDYIKRTGAKDLLMMVDDCAKVNMVDRCHNVLRLSSNELVPMLDCSDIAVFPADELTRQKSMPIRRIADRNSYSRVEGWFYDKASMNLYLAEKAKDCSIKIPKTFELKDVCIRPNTLSAGSKGVQLLDNVSVTEKINIIEEYVVDIMRKDGEIRVFPREVVLKNGYDRMIKPISSTSYLADCVRDFVYEVSPNNTGVFSDVFHLQLAKADDGKLYYIEWSKRISGTSLVNLFRGMNPFCFINGVEIEVANPFRYDEWYRYEDFVNKISCL